MNVVKSPVSEREKQVFPLFSFAVFTLGADINASLSTERDPHDAHSARGQGVTPNLGLSSASVFLSESKYGVSQWEGTKRW